MTDHYSPKTSATHVASVAPWLSAETFQEALTDVHDRGYVIIEDVLPPSDCDDYRQILEQFMAVSPAGRNVFEGTSSHRLYALLAKSERFADMIEHPLAPRWSRPRTAAARTSGTRARSLAPCRP